jgi:hypothetical protein
MLRYASFMVAPEAPDNESLRIELQEALESYRQYISHWVQGTGFFTAADVALVSYAFSQRIAVILLVASTFPMLMLVTYMTTATIGSGLINLVLRIERRLRIRKDSLGATVARTVPAKMIPAVGGHIEDLSDEEVRHLNLRWEWRWGVLPIVFYAATAIHIVLFVLSLTVFHYRFM